MRKHRAHAFRRAPSCQSSLSKSIFIAALCTLLASPLAQATVINFEDRLDGDTVTNQYAGVKFQNTLTLTAGLSLNEFEFAPSGSGSATVLHCKASIEVCVPYDISNNKTKYREQKQ